ncbi:MAG: carboxypeptidase-like regulatory domain-containing protein [Myxococcota bacterium]
MTMPAKGGGAYSDRRLADVELVDYARPGFAVVWLDGAADTSANARLAIRANEFETRLEPTWSAVAAGGTLDLVNITREIHTVSCPSLGIVRRLEPGEALVVEVPEAGAHPLFLLDRPQIEGGVYAANGPFAVLTNKGQFELRDLAPGPVSLHVWHPRFPPVARRVEVVADQTRRIDIEMGVGRGEAEASR